MDRTLTEGPVMKSMLRFALPMILGNLLQQCYNVADTLIVSWYLGSDALAVKAAGGAGIAQRPLAGGCAAVSPAVLRRLGRPDAFPGQFLEHLALARRFPRDGAPFSLG